MKSRKMTLLFACTVVSLAIFTGCGKKAAETSSAAADTTSAAAAETTTAAASQTETTAAGETTAAAAVEKPESFGTVTKLGNYEGLQITVDDTTVKDSEVDDAINQALANNPTITDVTDRPAQDGDTVNIDFAGTKDGVAFDGGTATGQDLKLGSNSFIDGFESGLVGANIGETRELNLTFPADYGQADLAGQAVVFTVTVNSIKQEVPAELTDDWVNTLTSGQYTTVAAYRDYLKQSLEQSKIQSADNNAMNTAIQMVINDSTIEENQQAIDYEKYVQTSNLTQQLSQYGMTMDSYLSIYGMTKEQFDNEMEASAKGNVDATLVVDEIFKQKNMQLEEGDYDYVAQMYGATKEDLVTQYGQDGVDTVAKNYKVINYILDSATKTVAETTAAAETAPAETAPAETAPAETAAGETPAETAAETVAETAAAQ